MRHAQIQDGTVINVIVWDGETPYDPGEGITLVKCPDTVGGGFTYDGKKFTAPEPVEPEPSALQGLRDELAAATSADEISAVVAQVIDALEQ
jgi:hypothetical protein